MLVKHLSMLSCLDVFIYTERSAKQERLFTKVYIEGVWYLVLISHILHKVKIFLNSQVIF